MTAAPGIERHVSRFRRRERFGRLLSILGRHGLLLLFALMALDALWPSSLPIALGIALTWLLCRLSVALMTPTSFLLGLDRDLSLHDELLTWRFSDPKMRESAMFAWLGRSLGQRLETLPEEKARWLPRVSVGRVRYLLPFLLLLLLLRLLAPLMPPLPRGSTELHHGAGSGAASGPGQPEAGEAPEPDTSEKREAPPPPPADRPDEPAEDSSPQPAKPLIEGLEKEETFLLPSFIGEGLSRPGKAVAGSLDESPGNRSRSRSAGGPDGADTAQDRQEFERAMESALRSRHVPASERPFVRRYFEALIRSGR